MKILRIRVGRALAGVPVAMMLLFGAVTAQASNPAGHDIGRVPTGAPAPLPTAFAGKTDRYDWSAVFEAGAPVADAGASYVALTPRLWRTVKDLNAAVNGRMRDDLGNRMDCVGYVKRKRSALIAAGVSAQALSAAIVVTPGGLSHTILLLSTETGDLVLDNLQQDVMNWNQTDYVWVEREIAGSNKDGVTRWAWVNRPGSGLPGRAMSR